MSIFKKIVIILVSILVLEIALIYIGYKNNSTDFIANNKVKKNIVLLVDVYNNKLSVFQDGKIFKTYEIAGGKPSTPSPIGIWKVTSKDTWGDSFGGHWMGINVPWGTLVLSYHKIE